MIGPFAMSVIMAQRQDRIYKINKMEPIGGFVVILFIVSILFMFCNETKG
jgi:hypothetical protein